MSKKLTKYLAIIMAVFTVMLCMVGCGSSETAPEDRVYIEESDFDAALHDGDAFKGKWIKITGQVFSVEKDGDTIAIQAWYDIENYDQSFLVYADKESVGAVKEDDFISVDGEIAGTFTGENMLGGEVTLLEINAETVVVGGYDDVYAPAESTKEIGETKDQYGLSVTLDRVEFAKNEARVYITVKNDTGDSASVYTYSAKAIQDGKQFEHEYNYYTEDLDIDEVLDGATKEGVIRFKGLDPDKPFKLTIEAYSDNWDLEIEDFVFEVE
ncbi:MAG: hypothetical protein E7230_05195 [Clostridiales bacterium]|nr:hypothetical protein [Clostridiales bacterium]MBR0468333.1 hypothetical protein [Mogibacterium sp.]